MNLRIILVCALVLGSAVVAAPQKEKPKQQIAKPPGVKTPPAPTVRKTPANIPDAQVNRLMKMSPEEREKVLANLPPARRQALEQRLSRLDELTPEQKAILDRRVQEFQKLAPPRRQAVREELQNLRQMRPFDRRARLKSPEFTEMYSPDEVRLMRDVWNTR